MSVSPPTFAHVLPFEDFVRLVDSLDEPGREPFARAMDNLAKPALRRLLDARREAGLLRPVPNSEGHASLLMEAWDRMVAGDRPDGYPDLWWERVLEALSEGALIRPAIAAQMGAEKPGADRDSVLRGEYARMAARLDAGMVSHFDVEAQQCTVTGERYRVAFDGWNPTFLQRRPDGTMEPMKPFETTPVREFEVEFETGELLAQDWFDIPEFTRAADGERFGEVGTRIGREGMSERYASMGFVSVHVGNTSPRAYLRDGALVFGHEDPDGPGAGSLGYVCTDYWGVTLIDRARLVAIVSGQLATEGEEVGADAAAEAIVEAYLASHDVLRLYVEPGRHWLYMSGETEEFTDSFAPSDADMKGIEPAFVVSPRRLSLDARPEGPKP